MLRKSVSPKPYCRFISSALCDVPCVNVGPPEIGTENCVPSTTGSNSVIGDPSWNCKRRLFTSFADRIAYQDDGQPMKFISLCDYTGFVETELFAKTYKVYGLETIKSPLIELEGTVEPFENQKGFTLRVLQVRQPSMK